MTIAIDGGTPTIKGVLRKFNTIGEQEINMVTATMRAGPLSGYLGGELHGGLRVEALEYEFAGMMGSKYAVAVNSATSGLLAACVACNIRRGSEVRTTPFTMSATAAAPTFLGAELVFNDIEPNQFNMTGLTSNKTKAVVVANIFGHPAELEQWDRQCRTTKTYLIEDNAQAPFAMEGKRHTGTIGDIGVFSFNIHKMIQAGEGGICVTDDETLATRMRLFRNHAELSDTGACGLNLRMTEVTAAIALAQLTKRHEIIAGRIELAEELTDMVKDIPWVRPPVVRENCKHVYYLWGMMVERDRDWLVRALKAEGLPIRAGYVEPLYKMPAFERFVRSTSYPVTEAVNDSIVLFEVCAFDPSNSQRKAMREAFKRVGGMYGRRQMTATAPENILSAG